MKAMILRSALLSAALLSLLGCGTATTTPRGGTTPPTEGPTARDTSDQGDKGDKGPKEATPAKAVVAMEAVKFFAEVKKDNSAAAKKYQGRTVELSGTVKYLDWATGDGRAYIGLAAGKGAAEFVTCYTREKKPWDEVSFGQQVKVRGRVPETFEPVLVDAEVTQRGPGAAPTVTAEALAAEFTRDARATNEKYKDRGLIVTGVIEAKEKREVTLEGDGKTKVVASFDGFVGQLADPLKVGDKIKIQVKYDAKLTRDSRIGFYSPLLMSQGRPGPAGRRDPVQGNAHAGNPRHDICVLFSMSRNAAGRPSPRPALGRR